MLVGDHQPYVNEWRGYPREYPANSGPRGLPSQASRSRYISSPQVVLQTQNAPSIERQLRWANCIRLRPSPK